MMMFFVAVAVFALCTPTHFVQGSKVSFTALPSNLSPCQSKTLTLRCSITDTQSSSSAVVGKRGLTQTTYDTSMILSVFITKASQNNKTIAAMSTVSGGVAKTDVKDLHVSGTLSSQTAERAYLEASWDNPTTSETGDYLCEINAVDPLGHSVIYFGELTVSLDVPCSVELAVKIKSLEQALADMKAKVDKVTSSHSETGVVVCDASDTWQDNNKLTLVDYQTEFAGKQAVKTVTFKKSYDDTPSVHVGVRTLGAYASKQYVSYDVEVTRVDEKGFDVTCTTWGDSGFYRLNINWISTV